MLLFASLKVFKIRERRWIICNLVALLSNETTCQVCEVFISSRSRILIIVSIIPGGTLMHCLATKVKVLTP